MFPSRRRSLGSDSELASAASCVTPSEGGREADRGPQRRAPGNPPEAVPVAPTGLEGRRQLRSGENDPMTSETATERDQGEAILASVEEKYGFRPNLLEEMAKAPAAARVYLRGQDAMADSSLSPAQQQAIQLTVATHNSCHYCDAAHTALGRMNGIEAEDLEAIRSSGDGGSGTSSRPFASRQREGRRTPYADEAGERGRPPRTTAQATGRMKRNHRLTVSGNRGRPEIRLPRQGGPEAG